MKKEYFEQYKRMLRFFVAMLSILGTTLIFTVTWIKYYNLGTVFPYYMKGHWMMAAVYALLSFVFMFTYGGMKFGYLKRGNIIFSQILSVICANAVGYMLIVLLSARFVTVLPLLVATAVDGVAIVVWVTLTDRMFKKLFPPRKILLL